MIRLARNIYNKRSNSRVISYIIIPMMCVLLQGCFTGVESTKRITLSKDEKKLVAPTAEEVLLQDVEASPYSEWCVGKSLIVVSDRGAQLFEPRTNLTGDLSLHSGDTLYYRNQRRVTLPDGNDVISLIFTRHGDEFCYVPRKNERTLMSDELPGVIDPEMVEATGRKLVGMTLWTKSALWGDSEVQKIAGRKYEKIKVLRVEHGNMIFPLKVLFRDENNEEQFIMMNFGNSGNDSRSFASMFSLTDPHDRYPHIKDEFWESIRRGRVVEGMTKDECRLAKGNPSDVNTGHNYSHVLLIWGYPDGNVLYFVDGILQGINQMPEIY